MFIIIAIIIVLILLLVWFNPISQIEGYVNPYEIMMKNLVYGSHKIVMKNGGALSGGIIATFDGKNCAIAVGRGINIVDLDNDGKIIATRAFDTHGTASAPDAALATLIKPTDGYRMVFIVDDGTYQRNSYWKTFKSMGEILPDFDKVAYRESYLALFKYGKPVAHAFGGAGANVDVTV